MSNHLGINKIFKPIIEEEVWKVPTTGVIKFKCTNCDNSFIEPFDKIFPVYKYCPICGVRIEE